MIEVELTKSMLDLATSKAKEMGGLQRSITAGDGNIAGFAGEIAVQSVIGGKLMNTYDYDLIKDDITYDIKTKRCTSRPSPEYANSIASYSKVQQKCDRYIFVRISIKSNIAYILGWYDKQQYFKDSIFRTKGDIIGSNKFAVKEDCYNLPISDLYSIERLL